MCIAVRVDQGELGVPDYISTYYQYLHIAEQASTSEGTLAVAVYTILERGPVSRDELCDWSRGSYQETPVRMSAMFSLGSRVHGLREASKDARYVEVGVTIDPRLESLK